MRVSVAVVGVGRIGAALVDRFQATGFAVSGHDVDPDREAVVVDRGARWAPTLADAVSGVDVVVTALPGSLEVLELVTGPKGLLAHLAPPTCWIDVTSAAPDVSRRCSTAATAAAVDHLDAPLGGGVDAVAAGQATVYVGGHADTLRTIMPVLRSFADTVHHVGGHGAGHLIKLLVNTLWFGQVALVTEALLLAERHGVTGEGFRTALEGSAADSAFVQRYLPHLLVGDHLEYFGLDRCVEELAAVEDAAVAAGLPHSVTSAVADVHRAALDRFGPVDGELLAAAWLRERSRAQPRDDVITAAGARRSRSASSCR